MTDNLAACTMFYATRASTLYMCYINVYGCTK